MSAEAMTEQEIIRHRVIERLRSEWPGVRMDRDGYPYTAPEVREGGATAALIDLAGQVAGEVAAEIKHEMEALLNRPYERRVLMANGIDPAEVLLASYKRDGMHVEYQRFRAGVRDPSDGIETVTRELRVLP